MDVSADLVELGRTPMAVLCAGAKSILDIPRTLEVLVSASSSGAELEDDSIDIRKPRGCAWRPTGQSQTFQLSTPQVQASRYDILITQLAR